MVGQAELENLVVKYLRGTMQHIIASSEIIDTRVTHSAMTPIKTLVVIGGIMLLILVAGYWWVKIRPDGRDKRKLLRSKDVWSPLWWSPDSRFVAYVASVPFAINDFYRLRVRRLKDNSDDWVAEGQISGEYQWVTSPNLLEQIKSEATSH